MISQRITSTLSAAARFLAASIWIIVAFGKMTAFVLGQNPSVAALSAAVLEMCLGIWIIRVRSPAPHIVGLITLGFFLLLRATGYSAVAGECGCLGTATPVSQLPVEVVISLLVACHLCVLQFANDRGDYSPFGAIA